jgi:4-amino-4-deoxy-L-arabinose transferase-like glycosyltransferase
VLDGQAVGSIPRRWVWLVFAIAALLRVAALSSDAYDRLDWSAALLTDEGFYIHNARNFVLFGHARTDDFNNMLLAPILHAGQVAVFTVFGVGVVQARSVSVICSLLTLLLLWAALRRSAGEKVALTAVLFLALDHTNLLYNRLALMDTPATLPAVAAFYAFVRGTESRPEDGSASLISQQAGWYLLCGLMLGLTVTNRMLAAYLLPVPFLALVCSGKARRGMFAVGTGLLIVIAVYIVTWYFPHRAELTAMSAYYRTNQVQPHSLLHLAANFRQAVVGDFRGISPYLFRHTPVVYLLALGSLIGVAGARLTRRTRERTPVEPLHTKEEGSSAPLAYLAAWLVFGWVMLAAISYSPSRYYVTMYPAMASLAAIAVWRLPSWIDRGAAAPLPTKLSVAALFGFGMFHAVLAIVHYRGVLPRPVGTLIFIILAVAVAAAVLLGWNEGMSRLRPYSSRLVPATLVLWLGLNGSWMLDWVSRLDYSQIRLSHWLGNNLPAGSVLIGDVAPGVTMNNTFKAIHVQEGLANDIAPVERFEGSPRYLAILSGRWREVYWAKYYPQLLSTERLVKLTPVIRWDVGIFSVDIPQGAR